MQTCPYPLEQHFSKPEQSSSPCQVSLSAAGNFNIIFMLIFCYSVLAERFSSLSSASSLLLSLSLSIIFHEILIMQVLTIGVTLNKNNFASTTQPVHTRQQCSYIWARGPAKPPCHLFNIYADMYKYQVISINERTEVPKPDAKTPQNQQVEKTRGTCTPDQGSGATLGVLGYASA